MKIAYAFRRCASYPYNGGALPTDATDRQRFLKHAKEIGFDGIELPPMSLSDAEAKVLRSELEDAGMPCVATRGGGGAARDPQVAAANKQRMIDAVHFAAKMGTGIVNSTVTTPPPTIQAEKAHIVANPSHKDQAAKQVMKTTHVLPRL